MSAIENPVPGDVVCAVFKGVPYTLTVVDVDAASGVTYRHSQDECVVQKCSMWAWRSWCKRHSAMEVVSYFDSHRCSEPVYGFAGKRWIAQSVLSEVIDACRKAIRSLECQQKYVTEDRQAIGHNKDAIEVLEAAVARAEGKP
jgi:hypothetical protein